MGFRFISTPPRAALLAGLYSAVSTGAFYGFSIYSPALKKQLSLSQQEVVNINTVPYAFGVGSFLWGAITQRLGLAFALLVGGLMLAGSQLILYGLATKMIAPPPFLPLPTALVAAGVFAFFGLQLTSSAAFTAPVQHFPQFRGAAASLVKSFVGLGGAVTTQTFVLIWGTPTADVTALNALLLWAGFGLAVNVLAAILMPSKASPDEHEEPKAVLDVLFFALTVLGCFATVVGIVPNDSMVHTVLVYGLLILALAPVLIIFGPIGVSGESNGHSMPSPVAVKASLQRQKSSFESPVAYDLGQMLCRSETWLLWFCGAVILGSGNVLATNMAQIIESMGAENKLLPTAVTLFSTGNLLGRLLCTIPSDAIVKRGWPRPLFVAGIAALAAASHLSLLCAALVGGEPERVFGLSLPFMRKKPIDESVLPTSMLQASLLQGGALGGGLAFGAMWPHFVVLASELFGSAHLATNYMFFDGSCGAAGTMLLANALPAYVYAKAAGGAADCDGPMCFGPTHGVIAALCGCAVIASAMIGCKSAELYRSIAEEKKLAAMREKDTELL